MPRLGNVIAVSAALVAGAGCTKEPAVIEVITFHDRNGDGKVDMEHHRFPEVSDSDWELRDEDFDGRFEAKWYYGVGLHKSTVNQRVPTNVVISP